MSIISNKNYKKNIGDRVSYLDAREKANVDALIAAKKPLYFLPCYMQEQKWSLQRYARSEYTIILIGIFEDGRRANVVLNNILPFFEVMLIPRLPQERAASVLSDNDTAQSVARLLNDNIILTADEQTSLDGFLTILASNVKKQNKSWKPTAETLDPIAYELFEAKPFLRYRPNNYRFARFYYKDNYTRCDAIKLLRDLFDSREECLTTHDDLSRYPRVVCRDLQISFSSWCEVSNYTICSIEPNEFKTEDGDLRGTPGLKGQTLIVNLYNYDMRANSLYSVPQPTLFYRALDSIPQHLKRDKTMSLSWDIETFSSRGIGYLPAHTVAADKIFCIGMTFQWTSAPNSFLRICLVDYPAEPQENIIIIVCNDEKTLIETFADIFERLSPDIVQAFNDGDYDWPWLVNRAKTYGKPLMHMGEKMSSLIVRPLFSNEYEVEKKYYRQNKVKLEAGKNAEPFAFMAPGYIPVDVRVLFRRRLEFRTAESSSLKFFCEACVIKGKEDMPIARLFDIYDRAQKYVNKHGLKFDNYTAPNEIKENEIIHRAAGLTETLFRELGEVAYYCVIDTERCHDLMRAKNVITDHRETSKLAYCSLFDAFYYADGMKVRNLTIAIGQRFPYNIRFSNITGGIDGDTGKYKGAFVIRPEKGLKISKLSIRERIRKAQEPNIDAHAAAWRDTSEEEIKQFYSLIQEHGAYKPAADINQIERNILHQELPQKFRDFWSEPMGRPIAGLDFSSLYPSIIRAANFSPEMCIKTGRLAQAFLDKNPGTEVNIVEIENGGKLETSYFIHHNNEFDINSPKFRFGVYPYILHQLFNMRDDVKKYLKKFDHQMEEYAHKYAEELKQRKSQDERIKKIIDEYDNISFEYSYYNSKQNAIKVFMNTFYGSCGSKSSPFYALEVAAGTTSYGRANLMAAKAWVEEMGCKVYYGDTDSLYISLPDKNFAEVDKAFYTEKIDKKAYWTDLVNLSFAGMNDSAVARGIVSRINKKFLEDNGTEFLKMAYEEFLWPVLFAARKKYIGIDHKHIVNFKPDKLFIRGFEIKKRGTSEFLKKVFGDIKGSCGITSKIFSFNNLYTVMELCLLAIDDIYAHPEQFKFEDFIQTAEYRADKKNVKVIEFRNRMAHTNTPVKAGERFEYVITRRHPYKYDTRGRKSKLKIGERMEFLYTARAQNMQIDVDHYMHGSVNGQLARLIVYEPQFEVMPLEDNESEIKIADEKTYQNAVKFIKKYAARYYTEYADVGGVYKSMYRHVNAQFQTCIKSGIGLDKDLIKLINCDYLNEDTGSPDWLFARAEKDAAADVTIAIGNDFISLQILSWENLPHFESEAQRNQCIRKYIGKIDELFARYVVNSRRGFKTERMIAVEVRDAELTRLKVKYTDMQAVIAGLYSSHDASLRNAIEACKRGANISAEVFHPIKNGDEKKIAVELNDMHVANNEINSYVHSLRTNKKLRKAWQGLRDFYAEVYNAHMEYYSVERICEALTAIKNKTINYVARPENIAQVIREDVRNDAKDLPDELFDM